MFEAAELGNSPDKRAYERELPKLRAALLEAQRQLAGSKHSCLIIVGGDAAAGKGSLVDTLLAWMDARGILVHTFVSQSREERKHPEARRYWDVLPAAGHTSIFFGSWYSQLLADRAYGRISDADLESRLRRIVELERMLISESVIVFKIWLHLSHKAQKQNLAAMKKDPLGRAHLTHRELRDAKHYKQFRESSEHLLRLTSTGESPWLIVNAAQVRQRNLTVGRALAERLHQAARLDAVRHRAKAKKPPLPVPPAKNLLSELDYSRTLTDAEASEKIDAWQARLAAAANQLHRSKRSAILVFEGTDAAGKGGAIRRLTNAMDARIYQVRSVAAPTDEERAHPYLWRFWRGLPDRGRMTIYDRSWYGRVLVERLEGFAAPSEWMRAYSEINEFEEQLVESGAILLKFWLAISPAEQLRRFKDRQGTPYKQYKLTEEDWRNRKKWDGYTAAACEMFEKTSTEHAGWEIISAEDKKWARVQVLKRVVKALEDI